MLLSVLAFADRRREGSSRTSGAPVSIEIGLADGTSGRVDARDEEQEDAETSEDAMGEISAVSVSIECLFATIWVHTSAGQRTFADDRASIGLITLVSLISWVAQGRFSWL